MDYKELLRKSIHFLGLSYIPAYDILGRENMIMAVGTITIFAMFIEILRHRYKILPELLLRSYEKRSVGAYIYFGIATFVITVILPRNSCFIGIIVSSLGDGISGILKHLFGLNKHLASLGMLISTMIAVYLLNLLSVPAFFAVIAGVIAERVERIGNFYINDNLSVPLVSAFVHRALEIVL